MPTDMLNPAQVAAELRRRFGTDPDRAKELAGQIVELEKLKGFPMQLQTDRRIPPGVAIFTQAGREVGRIVNLHDGEPLQGIQVHRGHVAAVSSTTVPIPAIALALVSRVFEEGFRFEVTADRLELTIPGAPRTKKNGTSMGIRQRKSYRTYRDAVQPALAILAQSAGVRLEERPYNVAARFYVDRGGEQADRVGLEQGLYDILQNAGVIADDWYFRTGDGTRVIAGDPHPRVELTITPIEE
jgi:hypothetical protein